VSKEKDMQPKKAWVDPVSDPAAESLLEQVRVGMKVVDAVGEDLGTVEFLKMGDPEAVTEQGEDLGPTGAVYAAPNPTSAADNAGRPVMAMPLGALDQPLDSDLPEPIRARLLREGFFKIEKGIIFHKHRYVDPEQIASVSGDVVKLKVKKDELVS